MAIDRIMLGNKIRRCRENLSLDIADVASSTGISSDRLNDFEQGNLEPFGDEILIISDLFQEDYRYFISNEKLSASEKVEVLYRKFGGEFDKDDRRRIQEFILLCESEEYVAKCLNISVKSFVPKKYPNVYKNQGIETAKMLRTFLGYNNTLKLYKDIFFEFRSIGIHIFRRKLKNSRISGLFMNHPSAGKCILINYDEDIFRQNFTLAHEICHALLDADSDYNVSFKKEMQDYRELRANAFAGYFLMPDELIFPFKSRVIDSEIIIDLAVKLKVNIQPLLIALKSRNIITHTQYKEFEKLKVPLAEKQDYELKGLSEKRYKEKRALLEMGLSDQYVKQCYEAYLQGYVSTGKLAEMFMLSNDKELVDLLNLYSLKLSYEY